MIMINMKGILKMEKGKERNILLYKKWKKGRKRNIII